MAKLLAVGLIAATFIVASQANCAPGALICQPAGGLGGLGGLGALDNDLDLNLALNLNHQGLGLGLGGPLPLHRLGLLKKQLAGPIIKPLPIIVRVPVPVAAPALLPPLPAPVPAPVPPPAPLPRCGCIVPSCSCLTK